MALNLPFTFDYEDDGQPPRVALRLFSREQHGSTLIVAFMDTGAEATLLDTGVAQQLRIDLDNAPTRLMGGLGGQILQARTAEVDLWLLDSSDLSCTITATFAPGIVNTCGNLLGLDVLRHFDFGLQHSLRTGYLGITAAAAGV